MNKLRILKISTRASLIVAFLVLSFVSMVSASQWVKTYGGPNDDLAYSIQQTADGGYIVAGDTGSFGAGNGYAWVLKLDGNGSVQWQKTYGGSTDDHLANSIQRTADGGYIVAGETLSFGALNWDAWVLKLDGNGSVQWQKTYGGSTGDDSANSIQQTADGGYVIAGWTVSFGAGNGDVWVLKLDGNGNVQWQKTYGGTNYEFASSIQQTADGGYIVAGSTGPFGGTGDAWALKLDGNGSVQWQKTYGGSTGDDSVYSIRQTADGGYIVAGETDSFGAGNGDAWVLKLDGNGSVQWQKAYGGSADGDFADSIQQTLDGGYIVAGGTDSFLTGNDDVRVLKLDGNGSVQWQKTYGGTNYEFASSIQQTADGGYVTAGGTVSFGVGNGSNDAWVLKFDANGNINNCSIVNTSNAQIIDTNATVQDTNVTGVDSYTSPQTSTASVANTNAVVIEMCYYNPVTLLVPTGGDVLPSGGTYAICWGASSNAVKFDLKYSTNNGTSWNLIKSVTGLNCTHWEIPVVTANMKKCRVKVMGYDSGSILVGQDISDKPFTIEVLRLTSPNRGETLNAGSTTNIQWTTNKTVRPVAKTVLKYTTDGITWKTIKTLSDNPGSYNWTVPYVTSTKCKVKVILKDSTGIAIGNDVSDKVFTIMP